MAIRRTPKLRRIDVAEPLTYSRRKELESGRPMFNDDRPLSEDELRALWESHRETVMREFVAENPGERPWCWWYFDWGKERPIVAPNISDDDVASHRNNSRFDFLHT